MALASDGTVFIWGATRHGQLGLEALGARVRLEGVAPHALPVVHQPARVKALCPSQRPAQQRVTSIACGDNHSLAVTCAGELLAWGCNSHGQLGLGDTCVTGSDGLGVISRMGALPRCSAQGSELLSARCRPHLRHPCSVTRWEPTSVPLGYEFEASQAAFRAVHAQGGQRHTAVLVSEGGRMRLRTCGDNGYGQLGHGDHERRIRCATASAAVQRTSARAATLGRCISRALLTRFCAGSSRFRPWRVAASL